MNRDDASWKRYQPLLELALIVVVVTIAYWPALQGTFLWDDNAHVTSPELRSFGGLYHIWFDIGATQQYYPLLHSAFWLEYQFWGSSPLGYHLTNVALHCVAAWLVFLNPAQAANSRCVLCGFGFRSAPGRCRIGGLDYRAEEHTFGGVLPERNARRFTVRRGTAAVAVLGGIGPICFGIAHEDRHGHAACGAARDFLVAARPNFVATRCPPFDSVFRPWVVGRGIHGLG